MWEWPKIFKIQKTSLKTRPNPNFHYNDHIKTGTKGSIWNQSRTEQHWLFPLSTCGSLFSLSLSLSLLQKLSWGLAIIVSNETTSLPCYRHFKQMLPKPWLIMAQNLYSDAWFSLSSLTPNWHCIQPFQFYIWWLDESLCPPGLMTG